MFAGHVKEVLLNYLLARVGGRGALETRHLLSFQDARVLP